MKYIFVALGLLIQLIFLFKREWLVDKERFLKILSVSAVLFVIGFLLKRWGVGDPRYVVLLENPLPTLIVFFLMNAGYVRLFGKPAVDTFWSMDLRLMKDGLFNFLFWLIGGAGPILLVTMVLN